jgi:tetratricopeptide (TPR) repeat protein
MKASALSVLLMLLASPQPVGDLAEAIRLYERGEYKQSVRLFQQLRSTSPNEPDLRLWLGKSYLKVREWDNAVQEMEKAVSLQPSGARYHLWLGRACGARASHSVFFTAIRWARRVVREFETARNLAPEDTAARFDLLDFYLSAPGIVGGGKDKAMAEAQAISKLDPPKGYTARAIIFQKDKKWDLAKKELIQATIDHPGHAGALRDLADYLLDRQDFAGAQEYAKRALALKGGSKRAQLLAAASGIRLHRDLDQAARTLEGLAAGTLNDDDPAFEEVYYWLGECYRAKGDKAKAHAAFESALGFNPDHARARESIAGLR